MSSESSFYPSTHMKKIVPHSLNGKVPKALGGDEGIPALAVTSKKRSNPAPALLQRSPSPERYSGRCTRSVFPAPCWIELTSTKYPVIWRGIEVPRVDYENFPACPPEETPGRGASLKIKIYRLAVALSCQIGLFPRYLGLKLDAMHKL
jgi:hypothetical protein